MGRAGRRPRRHGRLTVAKPPRRDPSLGEATRLIRAGEATPQNLAAHTVSPPLQRASTVILPNAAALYDGKHQTYGRMGLAAYGGVRATF